MATPAEIIDAARTHRVDAQGMAHWEKAMMLLGVLSLKHSSDLDVEGPDVAKSLSSPQRECRSPLPPSGLASHS